MSARQDVTLSRTPTDTERKFNYGKSLNEALGIASDARRTAQEAKQIAQEMSVSSGGLNAVFKLSIENSKDGGRQNVYSLINGKANKIHFEADSIQIKSTNFTLTEDGIVNIKKGNIGNCYFDGDGNLIVPLSCLAEKVSATYINADGIVAKNVDITGKITATSGEFTGTVYADDGRFTGTIEAKSGYFGNAHLITGAETKNITYDGMYLGTDSADDIFFGKITSGGSYTGALGLGGDTIITNLGVFYGDSNLTWSRILKAVIATGN